MGSPQSATGKTAPGYRREIAVVVILVLALGGGVIVILTFGGTPQTQAVRTQTSVTNLKSGLQLRLYLNASSSSMSGPAVGVFVDEYNPTTSTVNVTAANRWVVALNWDNGAPCGDDSQTVGFAIAEGYFTSSNVTTAKFLDLVNPGATYHCPLYPGYANPTGFRFQPMSDTADAYGSCVEANPCPSGPASTGMTTSMWGPITGYWNPAGNFTSFPRGVYTVVAADEWGNFVLTHFTID